MACLGLTSASELAYMSYAYAKVRDRRLYQKMTGIVRGSNLMGKCLSSTFAQIAVSFLHIEYGLLVYISLAGKKLNILIITKIFYLLVLKLYFRFMCSIFCYIFFSISKFKYLFPSRKSNCYKIKSQLQYIP